MATPDHKNGMILHIVSSDVNTFFRFSCLHSGWLLSDKQAPVVPTDGSPRAKRSPAERVPGCHAEPACVCLR